MSKFKKKVVLGLAIFFCVICSSASAENNTFVKAQIGYGEYYDDSPYITIDLGETLHIQADAYNNANFFYKVSDSLGNVITTGTITDGSSRAYPRGVPAGKYKIEVYCDSPYGPICSGWGSLDDN